jgi:hypothetical protein
MTKAAGPPWREAVNSAMRRIAFLDNEIIEVEQLIAAGAVS